MTLHELLRDDDYKYPMPQTALKWTDEKFDPLPFLKEGARSSASFYSTEFGSIFGTDCMKMLPMIKDGIVDTVFADPPFNIGKLYRENTDDSLPAERYVAWCKEWLAECVRILKAGGSLFLYNLPKWNILLGPFLQEQGLDFRHWVAVEMSACLPITGRLHPSHYSLLYYSKGKPNTFHRIRTPIMACRHCGKEVKDYGGHRDAMNPKGVTLKDVWTDIPPVRHAKFKSKNRTANALSTKLLDRVILMSTEPGDLVVDPFGGSGTTFAVCERTHRHWIGSEIDYADDIIDRLESGEIHPHKNGDYVE